MYCKCCCYDLRGQVEPRCPECGQVYCPDDPISYLRKIRGPLRSFARQIRGAVAFSPTFLTLGFIVLMSGALALFAFFPGQPCGPSPSLGAVSYVNLHEIITAWYIYRNDFPNSAPFDFTRIKNELTPALSAFTDQSILSAQFNRARAFRLYAWWLYALFIYAALMILSCHRHLRRWRAIPWLATVLIAMLIVVGHNLPSIERLVYPGSHAYINDYIYIKRSTWVIRAPGNGTRILAYEKQSWSSGYRAVAFMDGGVRMLKEGDLQTRLAAQGLTLDEE